MDILIDFSLGEKLEMKYSTTSEDKEARLEKIEKARQKEQLKAFVGMKLAEENQKLLEL